MNILKNKIQKIVFFLCNFMDTPYFALVLAFIELFCYYLGLDLLIIGVMSFCLSFAVAFKKNLNCLLVIFLFLTSTISSINSPSCNSNYYFQPYVYISCIFFAAIPVLTIIYKAIRNIIQKKVQLNALFFSIIVLGLAFLTNGIFYKEYNLLNVMFGMFMFFFFVILFFAVLPYTDLSRQAINLVSKQICIYLLVPIVEIIVFYSSFFIEGNIIDARVNINLGWGNRNTLGMILTVSLPFVAYLIETESKKSIRMFFFFFSCLCIGFLALTFSKQAYLVSSIFFFFYIVYSLSKAKKIEKKRHFFLLAFFFFLLLVFTLLKVLNILEILRNDLYTFDRIELWESALNSFSDYPIFGSGFFYLGGDVVVQLDNVLPYLVHNTLLQMLGTCGLFGIFSYLVYRFFTVKTIVKYFTLEKMFVVTSLSLMLMISLFDIHLFDFFGTSVYVTILCLSMSQKCDGKIIFSFGTKHCQSL